MLPSKRLKHIYDLYQEEIDNATNPIEKNRKINSQNTACFALIGDILDELEKCVPVKN